MKLSKLTKSIKTFGKRRLRNRKQNRVFKPWKIEC